MRRRYLLGAVSALLSCLAACGHFGHAYKSTSEQRASRAQLSIGYSLLYQEADGIPKLKWLLMFKNKSEEMSRQVDELVSFYEHLAETMLRLSKQYPAMRLDAPATSAIEGEARKAIGEDLAKDLAPVVGNTGLRFEREALLTFYDSLNEQRHLTAVMLERETDPGLKKFLETTKVQLDERYAKVGALLNRRYFTQ